MNKIMQALLLGAGASFDCGLPLLWELTAEIRRWLTVERLQAYNLGWQASGANWNAIVIEEVAQLLSAQDMHYEQIIVALQQRSVNAADAVLKKDFNAAYIFFLQALYGLLLERQVNNASYTNVALKDYHGLKKLAEQNKPLWIFSLNHDVVVEQLAGQLGIRVKSGFNETREIAFHCGDQSPKAIEFSVLSRADLTASKCDFFSLVIMELTSLSCRVGWIFLSRARSWTIFKGKFGSGQGC